jgi:hypothetical protein
MNNLKYPKDLVSDLEYKNNLASITFSTPLLTNYSFKGYSESETGAVTH